MTTRGKIMVVSSIDVGIGKTVATGLMARWFKDSRIPAITMKMVQTGGEGLSKDIIAHRNLADMEMLEEDAMGLTCPYVFSVACGPHLAARLDGRIIDPGVIVNAARELAKTYEYVLLEGVGGLFVPLTETTLAIDLCEAEKWPVILVTGPRFGTINHTLAALEALDRRDMTLQGLVYNLDGSSTTDPRIVADSRHLFAERIAELDCKDRICDIPDVSCTESYCVDFSPLFTLMK